MDKHGAAALGWGLAAALGCAPHDPDLRPSPVHTPQRTAVSLPETGAVRELFTTEPFRDRLPQAPADLVIHYGGESHGSLETCGCPTRPRGSLARFAGYATAADIALPTPSIRVNTGYFLTDGVDYAGQLIGDAAVKNQWMARGAAAARFDALNVSAHDIAGFAASPPEGSLPWVSANVSGPGVAKWVIVERGGHTIGITGITGPAASMADTSAWPIAPPAAAIPTLRDLAQRVDLVVLLAWNANDAVRSLVAAVPGVDVVLDAGLYADALPPVLKNGTLWTFSEYQLVRAGELRLRVESGTVVAALDRHIDLDDAVPDDPSVGAVAADALIDIDQTQRKLFSE